MHMQGRHFSIGSSVGDGRLLTISSCLWWIIVSNLAALGPAVWTCFVHARTHTVMDFMHYAVDCICSWFRLRIGHQSCKLVCRNAILDGSRGHIGNGRGSVWWQSGRLVTRNHMHWTWWAVAFSELYYRSWVAILVFILGAVLMRCGWTVSGCPDGLIPAGTFRVRTDPGKVNKVMEFKVEIFQVWKIMENDLRYGKVWIVMESVTADLEN